jgi:chromosome segregation ATPase
VGYNVPEVIRLRCQECQDHMKERPQVKQELHELTQSVRLSERKYRLVEGLIADSETQCESLQREIGSLNAKLKFDANKDGVSRCCFVVLLFCCFVVLLFCPKTY